MGSNPSRFSQVNILNNWGLDISQHDFSKRKTKKIVLVIGSPVESFCMRKDLLTFQVKIARNFDVFAHWCAKAISQKLFWRKSWYLRISLIPAISLFREILRNNSRKWWINSKPIRVNYTPACSALTHADRMSPNA